jgi:hypothetical protein
MMCVLDSLSVALATSTFDQLLHSSSHLTLSISLEFARSLRLLLPNHIFDSLFPSLSISLSSALSTMLTLTPRNAKDKLVFVEMLSFLSEHYASLLGREDIKETVWSTLSIVLPILVQCLTLASNISTGLPTSTPNVDHVTNGLLPIHFSMHIAIFQFFIICTSFSSLKSSTSLSVSNSSELSLHEVLIDDVHGRDCLRLMSSVLVTEGSNVYGRGLVSVLWENLLSRHPGDKWLCECAEIDSKMFNRTMNSAKTLSLIQHPIHALLRLARTLRAPDSFQNSHIATQSLVCLLHWLRNHNTASTGMPTHYFGLTLQIVSERELWQFCVRLMYDRRSEIRLLACELLHLLLSLIKPEPVDSNINDLQSIVEWPPVTLFVQIATDSLEAPLIRARCLRLLCDCIPKFNDNDSDKVLLRKLVRVLSDILQHTSSSSAAITQLETLSYLLHMTTTSTNSAQLSTFNELGDSAVASIVAVLKEKRVIPLAIKCLNTFLSSNSSSTSELWVQSVERVGLYVRDRESIFRQRARGREVDSKSFMLHPLSVIHRQRLQVDSHTICLSLCEVFLAIAHCDIELLRESLTRSSLAFSLVMSLDSLFVHQNEIYWQHIAIATHVVDTLSALLPKHLECLDLLERVCSDSEIDTPEREIVSMDMILNALQRGICAVSDCVEGAPLSNLVSAFVKSTCFFTTMAVSHKPLRDMMRLRERDNGQDCVTGSESLSIQSNSPFLSFFNALLSMRAMLAQSNSTARTVDWQTILPTQLDITIGVCCETSDQCREVFLSFLISNGSDSINNSNNNACDAYQDKIEHNELAIFYTNSVLAAATTIAEGTPKPSKLLSTGHNKSPPSAPLSMSQLQTNKWYVVNP